MYPAFVFTRVEAATFSPDYTSGRQFVHQSQSCAGLNLDCGEFLNIIHGGDQSIQTWIDAAYRDRRVIALRTPIPISLPDYAEVIDRNHRGPGVCRARRARAGGAGHAP